MSLPVIEAAKKIELPVELLRIMATHPYVNIHGFGNSGKSLVAAALANFIQSEYGVTDVFYLVDENVNAGIFKRDHRYGLIVVDHRMDFTLTGKNSVRKIAMLPINGGKPNTLKQFLDLMVPTRITPGTIFVFREDKLITCWYQGETSRMQFSFMNPFGDEEI